MMSLYTRAPSDSSSPECAAVRALCIRLVSPALLRQIVFMLGLSQTGNQGLKTVGSPWRCWSPTAVRWVAAVVSVAAATFVTLWLREAFQSTPNALFFCAIILSSRFGGLGPGLLAGVLSVLAIKYYSTPPLHTLALSIN
jgi:hypothetical protein